MANRLPASGTVTRLTLLSLLSAGPCHGYGLRRQIEAWRMDVWADIRYGSIYQLLARMAREGLVEELTRSREGRRPERATYAITGSGREELRRLVRQAWSRPSQEVQPVNVALSFLGYGLLPDAEIGACLEQRLASLMAAADDLAEEEQRSLAPVSDPGLAQRLTDHFDHFRWLIEVERTWTAQVLEHVQAGAYRRSALGVSVPREENPGGPGAG